MTKVQPVEKMLSKMHKNYKGSSTSGKNTLNTSGIVLSTFLFLGSLVDGAFDVTSNYSLEIGIALIVFGILCGFFGKKFVKPVSFLTGFIVGAGMSLGVAVMKLTSVSTFKSLNSMQILVISGAGGIVLGTLMLAFYKLIIYGILGVFIAVLSTLLCWEFTDKGSILQYPVASASFVIGTFLASLIPTFTTIVVTSGIGSYLLSVGIDCIIKSGFNHVFAFGFGYKWSDVSTNTSDEIFGLLALWIIMFMWMGIRQLVTKNTGRNGKFIIKNNSVHGKELMDA